MYVMVVDGNKTTGKRSMEILNRFRVGGQTFIYHSANKAVEHAMYSPVDFAFVRRKLPDLSGEEVEQRIKFLQPITKIYLMDEEILVSPRGDISVGLPVTYPWEETENETAERWNKQQGNGAAPPLEQEGDRRISKTAAILIAVFLGGLGISRFLAGKIGIRILGLLTGGCFGIGWLVDLI